MRSISCYFLVETFSLRAQRSFLQAIHHGLLGMSAEAMSVMTNGARVISTGLLTELTIMC